MDMTTEWGNVCIRLLQGPLFRTETADQFKTLLDYQQKINEYFAVIGLTLHIDGNEGYAFLIQNEDEDENIIGGGLRLLRKFPLSYEQSLLLVLLREELDKFEITHPTSHTFILHESQIGELLEVHYSASQDKVKFKDLVSSLLTSFVQMDLIKAIHRPSSSDLGKTADREFEIRTIIRAKINAEFLTEFKTKLETMQGEHHA